MKESQTTKTPDSKSKRKVYIRRLFLSILGYQIDRWKNGLSESLRL